jgi:hypothetical protein
MREQTWRQETIIDFIKLALAAFLMLTPWIFGFTSAAIASRDAWISGALIGLASLSAIFALADWEEWISLVLGLWVVISPWVLGFHTTVMSAMRIDVVVGIAVALFAAVELWMMNRNPPQVTA